MDAEEKDIALINKYLDFQLSEKELVSFEKKLTTDTNFFQKLQTYQQSETIVTQAFENSKHQKRTEQWDKILDSEEKLEKKHIPWRWIGGIAAGFILVLSIWQFNNGQQEPDINTRIADAWNKKIGLSYNIIRGENKDSIRQIIRSAFEKYENGDYQKVITKLKDINQTQEAYEDALLLRGLSLYRTGNTTAALQTLDSLIQHPTGRKSYVAKWYEGLIYLDEGNLKAARQFLEIPSDNNQEIKLK
ncbi:tol-pal system YbgF family protein [Aquimarina sp. RZ0]|uniref:tetratricopeptide repeat protein n=1 Tax=Aquimarina sp. RZ0 TaxID=2607730 RepID=UPI0011F25147|nr:tetratricopeptide repeat protein [Aquimarina sp. RZ0]KAA1247535.1 hypothetical protein F0000_03510 [Aquimarina sp. RZ0]